MALFFLLFSFGVATIPLSYLLSFFFETPSSGFVVMVIIYILTGLIANLGMSVIDTMMHIAGMAFSEQLFQFLVNTLRLFPIFSFLFGYQKVYRLSVLNQMCTSIRSVGDFCSGNIDNMNAFLRGCCVGKCGDNCYDTQSTFAFNWYGCGVEVCFLFVFGIVCFALIIIGEGLYSDACFLFC